MQFTPKGAQLVTASNSESPRSAELVTTRLRFPPIRSLSCSQRKNRLKYILSLQPSSFMSNVIDIYLQLILRTSNYNFKKSNKINKSQNAKSASVCSSHQKGLNW